MSTESDVPHASLDMDELTFLRDVFAHLRRTPLGDHNDENRVFYIRATLHGEGYGPVANFYLSTTSDGIEILADVK